MNSTEAVGCESSHRRHSLASWIGGAMATTGPIVYTVGGRIPRVHLPSVIAARTLGSTSAMVLIMMPFVSM
jgi:hypothetical protein